MPSTMRCGRSARRSSPKYPLRRTSCLAHWAEFDASSRAAAGLIRFEFATLARCRHSPGTISNLEIDHRAVFGADRGAKDAARFLIDLPTKTLGPPSQRTHGRFVDISDDHW